MKGLVTLIQPHRASKCQQIKLISRRHKRKQEAISLVLWYGEQRAGRFTTYFRVTASGLNVNNQERSKELSELKLVVVCEERTTIP